MTYAEWPRLTLDPREIFRSMGTGNTWDNITPEVLQAIEQLRTKAMKLIHARSVYTILPITVTGARQVQFDARFPFTCNARFFKGATHAALAIGTMGPRLEQESARLLQEGKYLEGLILDACGSVALDETLGRIREQIGLEAGALGQKLGYTLSPGCQMIPLQEQVIIFSLLDFESIEVGLSDSNFMIPGKSISAVIPLGVDLAMPNRSNYACEVCSLQKSCTYSPARQLTQ